MTSTLQPVVPARDTTLHSPEVPGGALVIGEVANTAPSRGDDLRTAPVCAERMRSCAVRQVLVGRCYEGEASSHNILHLSR